MKFGEIPHEAMRFVREKMRERNERLSDPELRAELERTLELLKEDFIIACGNALSASWRFTLGAPLTALSESAKEFGSVISHNFATRNEKDKHSYEKVPSTFVAELLIQYGKGAIDVTKLVANLSVAAGRATVLGGRYLIGK